MSSGNVAAAMTHCKQNKRQVVTLSPVLPVTDVLEGSDEVVEGVVVALLGVGSVVVVAGVVLLVVAVGVLLLVAGVEVVLGVVVLQMATLNAVSQGLLRMHIWSLLIGDPEPSDLRDQGATK